MLLPVIFLICCFLLPISQARPPDPKPPHPPPAPPPHPSKPVPPGHLKTLTLSTASITPETTSTFPVFSLATSATPTTVVSTVTLSTPKTTSAESQATPTASTKQNAEVGLSSGAKAGIGIGVTLAVLLIVGGGALEKYLKQRRAIAAAKEQDPFRDPRPGELDELDALGHGGKKLYVASEKAEGIPRTYQPYRPAG